MSHEYGIILAMRKTFAFVILAFASFAAFAAGDAGGDGRLYLADPFVLLDGGVYYAYGTGAVDGIPVAVSTNLVDWTIGVGVAKGSASVSGRKSSLIVAAHPARTEASTTRMTSNFFIFAFMENASFR